MARTLILNNDEGERVLTRGNRQEVLEEALKDRGLQESRASWTNLSATNLK